MSKVKDRRQVALQAISRFCAQQGIREPSFRVERRPGRIIAIIGQVAGGQEFSIGYSSAR